MHRCAVSDEGLVRVGRVATFRVMEAPREAEGGWRELWVAVSAQLAKMSCGGGAAGTIAAEVVTQAWLRFRDDPRPRRELFAWCIAVGARLARGRWRHDRRSAAVCFVEDLAAFGARSPCDGCGEVLEAASVRLGAADAATLSMLVRGASEQQVAAARRQSLRSVRASCQRIRLAIVGEE